MTDWDALEVAARHGMRPRVQALYDQLRAAGMGPEDARAKAEAAEGVKIQATEPIGLFAPRQMEIE